MNKLFGLALLTIALTFGSVGCGAQIQPSAPVYQCPTPNYGNGQASNYTPLQTTSTALSTGTTTYADDANPTGTYCYIAQAYESSPPQISAPSNVASATVTVGMAGNVTLSWTNTCTSCTIIISKTTAILVAPPAAPVMGKVTQAALKMPVFEPNPNLVLVAKVTPAPIPIKK